MKLELHKLAGRKRGHASIREAFNRNSLRGVAPPPSLRLPTPRGISTGGVVALLLLILSGALLAFYLQSPPRTAAAAVTAVRTVKVRRANFLRVLRLAGTTKAVHSVSIVTPRLAGSAMGSLVVTSIVPTGTRMKKGQVLVKFDRQKQYQNYLDKQATYRGLSGQLAVKRAAEDAARAKDQAALKKAVNAVATAKLQVMQSQFATRIQAEIDKETLQEDEAALKQLRQTYALKRQSAAAAIRDLQIQQQRAHQSMEHALQNARKMVIRSPVDGIVVLNQTFISGTIGYAQAGSSLYPGQSFMRVVDPSVMEAQVLVNQVDLPALQVGQQAEVHLVAYPDLSFPARLESLSPLGEPGQFSRRIMTFTAIFSIQGSNPKLMPDLSAAVDVRLQSEKDVLLVPIQSVAGSGKASYVWLATGSGFSKHQVRTGPENDLDVVIESGLEPGETIREYVPAAEGTPAK